MNSRLHRWGLALVFAISLAGIERATERSSHGTPTQAIFPPGSRPAGYKLGLLALSCWMGGVWSDAEGAPAERWTSLDHGRCQDTVATVYGRFDQVRYEQLRAGEERAIGDLVAKIRATASADSRDRTAALFTDVAAAAQEGMLARRAADRVKIDYDASAVEAKLTDDERRAAKDLGAHAALDRLLVAADPGRADRRAIGLLLGMDRMEIARGLPKQLKFFAVGALFNRAFDAPPAPATVDPTVSPKPGTWLAYLTEIASRAGHPTGPARAGDRKSDVEHRAWAGVMAGFADRLRRSSSQLGPEAVPELSRVVGACAARLDSGFATAERVAREHAEATR